MARLVEMLLDDLGLYGTVPGTFPELIVWLAVFTVSASLVAGTIKTVVWAISNMRKVGKV